VVRGRREQWIAERGGPSSCSLRNHNIEGGRKNGQAKNVGITRKGQRTGAGVSELECSRKGTYSWSPGSESLRPRKMQEGRNRGTRGGGKREKGGMEHRWASAGGDEGDRSIPPEKQEEKRRRNNSSVKEKRERFLSPAPPGGEHPQHYYPPLERVERGRRAV